MATEVNLSHDGWPEYKLTVIKQLDYLTEEMRLIRELSTRIDKELSANILRDTLRTETSGAALVLQAKEYDRRLGELNHAHERAIEDKLSFVSIEAYEAHCKQFEEYKREINSWKNDAIAQSATHRGEDAQNRRIWGFVLVSISIVISILAIVIDAVLRQ